MIKRLIVSFDLGNECFQEVLLPDNFGEADKTTFYLSDFRDCLCIISGDDVWVMKEYGNKNSWTKLFNIYCMREPFVSFYLYIQVTRVFDDKQVLLTYQGNKQKYISYNRKNGTSKLIEFNSNIPEVCVESLISPCF
jgi:F-box interacting protein